MLALVIKSNAFSRNLNHKAKEKGEWAVLVRGDLCLSELRNLLSVCSSKKLTLGPRNLCLCSHFEVITNRESQFLYLLYYGKLRSQWSNCFMFTHLTTTAVKCFYYTRSTHCIFVVAMQFFYLRFKIYSQLFEKKKLKNIFFF